MGDGQSSENRGTWHASDGTERWGRGTDLFGLSLEASLLLWLGQTRGTQLSPLNLTLASLDMGHQECGTSPWKLTPLKSLFKFYLLIFSYISFSAGAISSPLWSTVDFKVNYNSQHTKLLSIHDWLLWRISLLKEWRNVYVPATMLNAVGTVTLEYVKAFKGPTNAIQWNVRLSSQKSVWFSQLSHATPDFLSLFKSSKLPQHKYINYLAHRDRTRW